MDIQIILGLFLFIVGIYFYFIKPQFFLIFLFFLHIFALPIVSLLSSSYTYETVGECRSFLIDLCNLLLLIVLIIDLLRNGRLIRLKLLLCLLFVFVVYLVLTRRLIAGNFANVVTPTKEILEQLLPFFLITINRALIPRYKVFIKFLFISCSIQFCIGILNYFGIFLFVSHYLPMIYTDTFGRSFTLNESLICGSFFRYNHLANFITTCYLIFMIDYSIYKRFSQRYFVYISLLFFVLILATGAKISFVLICVVFLIYAVINTKRNKSLLVGGLCLITSLFVFLFNVDKFKNTETGVSGVDRTIEGLSSFMKTDKDEDDSTIALSTYLLENYFIRGAFFGNANTYKGEFAYGNHNSHTLVLFKADARVAYIIVEFGLIGLYLYFLLFYSVVQQQKNILKRKVRKYVVCSFIYFSILTITEPGFFDQLCYPLSVVFFASLSRPQGIRKRFVFIRNNIGFSAPRTQLFLQSVENNLSIKHNQIIRRKQRRNSFRNDSLS